MKFELVEYSEHDFDRVDQLIQVLQAFTLKPSQCPDLDFHTAACVADLINAGLLLCESRLELKVDCTKLGWWQTRKLKQQSILAYATFTGAGELTLDLVRGRLAEHGRWPIGWELPNVEFSCSDTGIWQTTAGFQLDPKESDREFLAEIVLGRSPHVFHLQENSAVQTHASIQTFNTQINIDHSKHNTQIHQGDGFTESDREQLHSIEKQVTSKPKGAEKAPPKKKTRRNMSKEMANEILLGLLKRNATKHAGMSERELTELVGCSRETLRKTESYKSIDALREELKRR